MKTRSQESGVRSQNISRTRGCRLLASCGFLALLLLAALFWDRTAGASYAHQFRDFPGAPISWRFP